MVKASHNNLAYDVLGVKQGVTLDDPMPFAMELAKPGGKGVGVDGGAEVATADAGPPLTFRQYYKYFTLPCHMGTIHGYPIGNFKFVAGKAGGSSALRSGTMKQLSVGSAGKVSAW